MKMHRRLGVALLAAVSSLAVSVSVHAADLIYNLSGNSASYNSTTGGPALTPEGGTLTAGGYAFAANQGLTLTHAVTDNYSILITFEIDATSGYRKLIDFDDKGSDFGLYNLNNQLNFYNFVNGNGTLAAGTTIQPGVMTTVVLNRDSTTQLVTGFVNGVQVLQFTDTGGDATFTGTNGIIRFFEDDTHTSGTESSSGTVTQIEISPSSTAFAPEPNAALGVVALGALVRLRRRARHPVSA